MTGSELCLYVVTDQCPLQSFHRLPNNTVSINFTNLVANVQCTWHISRITNHHQEDYYVMENNHLQV